MPRVAVLVVDDHASARNRLRKLRWLRSHRRRKLMAVRRPLLRLGVLGCVINGRVVVSLAHRSSAIDEAGVLVGRNGKHACLRSDQPRIAIRVVVFRGG